MKTIYSFVFAILLPAFCMAQHAQVHDAMEDKYGEPGKEKANNFFSKMNGKYEPEYKFTLSMVMHITTYKKGEKKDESDLKYYFNTGKQYFAFENQQKKKDDMFMIYDNPNTSMIMLSKKDMSGMAININAFRSQASIDRQKNGTAGTEKTHGNLECKKTGKTKVIEGYTCFEYVCTDNDKNTRTETWITDKIPFDISQSFSKGPYAAMFRNTYGIGGMMMEVYYYKNDKLESTIQVTNINNSEDHVVKTKDYKFATMQMN